MDRRNSPLRKLKVLLIIAVFLLGMAAVQFGSAETSEVAVSSQTAEFPYPGDDWAWSMVGSQYAHKRGEYGEDVVVAVLDTGIDYTHPDLEDKMVDGAGYDFVDNDDDPMDEHGHGTHVAGIIASVAPGAELMALRVIEESGGDWVDVSKAIEYARTNGADIISMSFGGQYNTLTPAFELQMDRAYTMDDILHVAAAGNDDSEEKFYPAGYDSVISVSAVDSDKEKAGYSNYGDWIEMASPGGGSLDQVYSTLPNESYGEKIGTSMACPFVSGVAALRRSLKPEETNDDVRGFLQETAIDLGDEQYYGHGLVNAYRAAGGEVPTPVQELKADPNDSRVELSWEEPWHQGASAVEGYRIYRTEAGGEMEMIEEVGPEQYNYTDQNVENEVTYQYTITAYNAEGESIESDVVQATPREEAVSPSSPRELDAELVDDGVELTWKEPLDDGGSSITGYNVYRRVGEDEMKKMGEVDGETNSYIDNSVELGNEYTYAVTAENEVGESEKSETVSIFVPKDHGPSSPRDVNAELLEEGVEIGWQPPEDDSSIVYYNVYRKESGNEEFEWLGEVDAETTRYLDKTVSPSTEYTYAVASENEIGESEKSLTDPISVPEDHDPSPTEPSSPREVSAEVVDQGVKITWQEPVEDGGSSIKGYKIYRKEAGEDDGFELIGETDGETLSYIDDTVSAGSEYTYAVTAENEIGESEKAHSSQISVTEDYTPSEGDEGWLDRMTESDMLIPLLIVAAGLLIVVIAAISKRNKS